MDCNGLLWIFRNPVNGFEDTSMDCYGVFSGRRPDAKKFMIRNAVFMRLTSVLELSNTPILRQSMQDF